MLSLWHGIEVFGNRLHLVESSMPVLEIITSAAPCQGNKIFQINIDINAYVLEMLMHIILYITFFCALMSVMYSSVVHVPVFLYMFVCLVHTYIVTI